MKLFICLLVSSLSLVLTIFFIDCAIYATHPIQSSVIMVQKAYAFGAMFTGFTCMIFSIITFDLFKA